MIVKKCLYLFSLVFVLVVVGILIKESAFAFKAREELNILEQKEFQAEELFIYSKEEPLENVISQLRNSEIWRRFIAERKDAYVYIDPRSGRLLSLMYSLPFIPGIGDGNNVKLEDLSEQIGYSIAEVNDEVLKKLVIRHIDKHKELLRVRMDEIGEIIVSHPADYLWHINVLRQYKGVPVKDARITFVINHGNLVLWGMEKWGDIDIEVEPNISSEQAMVNGFSYIGGESLEDEIVSYPRLEIVPIAPRWNGEIGEGYDYALVWVFGFRRAGYNNNWEVVVDAQNGSVLSFLDKNLYVKKRIIGSIYPLSSDECCPEGCAFSGLPAAYMNTGFAAPNNYTNGAGYYEYTSGVATTTLDGLYVVMGLDYCGTISESSATGDIDLGGVNGDHDCTVPDQHSAGDTFASRSCALEVTLLNRQVRGWLNLPWLDTAITCNVNISSTCNAYFSSGNNTINFYRSGGGCRNTGEIAAIFDHEWGHGIDYNDATPSGSSPVEAIADISAVLRLHTSCVGRGFFWTLNRNCGQWTNCPSNPGPSYGYNCSGYDTSECCLECTGVRELDYMKHSDTDADTVQNFVCAICSTSGSYFGPCGREAHCEGVPSAMVGWDLAARDLQAAPFNMDKQTAFEVANKIILQGHNNVSDWYSCTCPDQVDACAASNAYPNWIAADDDDGNLSNGTPHMTAIYNAMNRHGIACATPTPQNSGCSSGPTGAPTLSAAVDTGGVHLSWTAVSGANQYYIFKAIGAMGCDVGKVKIAQVGTTNYTDVDVGCEPTYYSVLPVGSNASCIGMLSNCVSVLSSIEPPTNVNATATAPNQVTVTWSPASGAIGYNLYRKYNLCGGERLVNIASNITGTSYVDNTVSGGITYGYALKSLSQVGINVCESDFSSWVGVTPSGVCKLEPCFDGIVSAVNSGSSTCQINLTWDGATTNCSGSTLKYNIYRSTDPNFEPSLANRIAKCVSGTTYADMGAVYATPYYYVVRAEDTTSNGNGPCNNGNEDTNVEKRMATAAGPPTVQFSDDFEGAWPGNWTVTGNWVHTTDQYHSQWYSVNGGISQDGCHYLSLTNFMNVPVGLPATVSFWKRIDTNNWNGGKVEASGDGTNWTKLTVTPPYNGTKTFNEPCMSQGEACFTGTETTWTQHMADIPPFTSGSVKLRFTWAVRWNVNYTGWWIDDVEVSWGGQCETQGPGAVPGKINNTLTVSKSGNDVILNWQPSGGQCTPTGYGVYRGTLPWIGYNHNSRSCSVLGNTYTDSGVTGSYYYLVVPLNADQGTEGSYGVDSNSNQIPPASSPCGQLDLTDCN